MLPKNFKPKNEYNLIRLGRNNDGGYLVEKNSLNEAKSLISFGLSYDWTFEKHFSRIKDCPVHCYDPTIKYSSIKKFSRKNILNLFKIKNLFNKDSIRRTINNIFLYSDYKKFFSKEIIHYESSVGIGRNKINFSEIVNRIKSYPIFLKIDIEGSEYRILDDILKYQDKIAGLVIEFHNIDLHVNIISDFINKFNLSLCHIHGQNPSGTDYLDLHNDPIQVEMTFSNTKNILSTNPKIPHFLDQPADLRFQDVKLNFVD
jgi:hypothetical protein|tara:strand:- start:207 stop:983 length:777 start_codon:yes stop_codon:yes gene_type:complete